VSPTARLGAYALVLATTFAGGAALGAALGPINDAGSPTPEPAVDGPGSGGHDAVHRGGLHGHGR
jgi:hypothetical protein